MTVGELADAKRRALNHFDHWLRVTGVIDFGTSYYYEIQAIIRDSVEMGAQAALGIEEKLESELLS